MCTSQGGQAGIGAEDWAWEGMASAVQIRYLERDRGVQFEHPYLSSQFAAWTRYFDHPKFGLIARLAIVEDEPAEELDQDEGLLPDLLPGSAQTLPDAPEPETR